MTESTSPAMSVGNLTKALSEARDRCKPAPNDAQNAYHKYRYTSAEAVVTAANEAMQKSGLALIPLLEDVRPVEATGTGDDGKTFVIAKTVLDRTWILSHESGESLTLRLVGWPVIPEKGRPLDKALAGALTGSLAYRLRDLLQIPRISAEDDISGRDDTDTENHHGVSTNGKPQGHSNGSTPKTDAAKKEAPKPVQPSLEERHKQASKGLADATTLDNLDKWAVDRKS